MPCIRASVLPPLWEPTPPCRQDTPSETDVGGEQGGAEGPQLRVAQEVPVRSPGFSHHPRKRRAESALLIPSLCVPSCSEDPLTQAPGDSGPCSQLCQQLTFPGPGHSTSIFFSVAMLLMKPAIAVICRGHCNDSDRIPETRLAVVSPGEAFVQGARGPEGGGVGGYSRRRSCRERQPAGTHQHLKGVWAMSRAVKVTVGASPGRRWPAHRPSERGHCSAVGFQLWSPKFGFRSRPCHLHSCMPLVG